MNYINHKFFSILAVALLVATFSAFSAHAMDPNWYARESHGSKTRSNENKREAKQMWEVALLKKAYELAETIAYENDRTSKVQVWPVTFEMVPESALKKNDLARVFPVAHNTRGRNQNADIKLSRILKKHSSACQVFTILHELAHTYDKHLWDVLVDGRNETSFDSYSFLKNDMLACQKKWNKVAPEMSAKEWYADWQAIQWLKKYAPEHIAGVREDFKKYQELEKYHGVSSLIYAPHEIQLKWLES